MPLHVHFCVRMFFPFPQNTFVTDIHVLEAKYLFLNIYWEYLNEIGTVRISHNNEKTVPGIFNEIYCFGRILSLVMNFTINTMET